MSEEYTVQRGDCLSRIARDHGVTLAELLEANPQFTQDGRNPNLIYPGETVVIPGESAFPAGSNPCETTATCPRIGNVRRASGHAGSGPCE